MPAPSVLPGRAYQNTSRKSQLLFHFRASDLALTTVSGDDGTFSRSSVAGMVTQRGLPWADSTSGIRLGDEGAPQQPSWGYFLNSATGLYEPALVLGSAYTNLVSSDDIDGGWTDVETPVITTGISDPRGGTGAYRVADDNAGAVEGVFVEVTFAGDDDHGVGFVVREATMASAGNQALNLWDDIAGVNRLSLAISAWTGGEPTVTADVGTYLGSRYVGNGYWLLLGQATSVDHSHHNYLLIYPAATAAATGSIDVFRAMAFEDPVPPPFTLSASVARTADSLTFPYLAEPQAATYLYEGIVADLPTGGVPTFFDIGQASAASVDAHLAVYMYLSGADKTIYIDYGNGADRVYGRWTVPTLALGDRISIRFQQIASGAIDAVGLTINGGAEDTTLDVAFGAPIALPAAWKNTTVRYSGTTATNANSALTKFVAAAGSWTTAQMQQMY